MDKAGKPNGRLGTVLRVSLALVLILALAVVFAYRLMNPLLETACCQVTRPRGAGRSASAR
jgi:hypothetical protein